MSRRVIGLGAGLVITLGLFAAAAWLVQGAGTTGAAEGTVDEPTTATVSERTLRVVEEADGMLGYGETRPLLATSPGTITAVPEAGTRIERGGVLYELNGSPTLLLLGEMPAWRTLEAGVTGPDVEQLEANLIELGYGEGITLDDTWDLATTAAVEAWQEAAGMAVDGAVDFGEIVFEPEPVMVAAIDAGRAASVAPGVPVLQVTGTQRVVTVPLSASQRDGVEVNDSVEVELTDGSVATATVTEIDTAPTTAQDGTQTYGARLSLEEVDAPDGPVTVRLVRQEREDVLAVPVTALLALLEGGYAVERVTDDGGTELVAVDVGLFADGWVEIRGDVQAGDEVVVP